MKQKGYDIDEDSLHQFDELNNLSDEQWKAIDDNMMASFIQTPEQRSVETEQGRINYEQQVSELVDEANRNPVGYGDYSGDSAVQFEEWITDPQNYRANSQSSLTKFGNGAAKFIPYAITTFLDNTLGLVGAITNVAIDADIPLLSKEGRSFIDTPFADAMQSVRDWSEKTFPNYRTTEEIDEQDQWWKHLNANFWGDTFLKNLGFTVGAGLSGAAYGKAFRALQPKIVDKAYKAAVAASVNGDMAAEEAFRKVLQGGAMQNPKKIYDTFASVRKSYQRMNAESQLLGGIGGAIGESRVEAMSAAKEFRDEYIANAQSRYNEAASELGEQVSSNPNYIGIEPLYDGYGNQIGTRPILNSEGRLAYENGLADIQKNYNDELSIINGEASNLANTVFWLNMPLLTASNIIQFGRLFSGGFKTQSKLKIGGSFGAYGGEGTVLGAIGKGISNSATEGIEEMSQRIFSEGSKDIAEQNIAAFHNGKYDKDSIRSISEWLMSMSETAGNTISDPKSWQEFAVGALTGALGIPSGFSLRNWQGGVIGGIQEGLADRKASQEAAGALNKRIASSEFKNLWEGLVRHNYYEKRKDEALKENNSFSWHNNNDAEILSDVMMFADAGRLNDLEDYIDSFANIKIEEIPRIKASFIDETDQNFNNKSDEQLLDWIHKRAFEVKRTINQYRDFHDSIDYLSFGTTDVDTVNELIYTQAQLQNFEDRYNSILREMITKVRPTIERVSREIKTDGWPTERAIIAQDLLSGEENLTGLFGGYALDIHGRAQDAKSDTGSFVAAMIDDKRQESVLNELEKWGAFTDDPSLKEQVKDMQKLVRSRQNFYAKLFDPTFRQKFEKQAETPETVSAEIQKELATEQTDGLKTLSDVKQAYFEKDAKRRADFIRSLETVEDSNSSANEFLKIKRRYDSIRGYLQKNGINTDNIFINPAMIDSVINTVFRRAQSESDLINLPDTVLPTVDEFIRDYKTVFMTPSVNTFEDLKRALRDAMVNYASLEASTSSRQTIDPQKIKSSEANMPVSTSDGYDAPQPGSIEPAPVVKKEEKTEQPRQQEKEPESQPVRTYEKEQTQKTPISHSTSMQLVDDAAEAMVFDTMSEEDEKIQVEGEQDKIPYYRTSVPEIETAEARRAREHIRNGSLGNMKLVNLADFVESHPEYATIWNALKDRNAFQNTAISLEVGDEVEFVIDPTFPTYADQPQILMTTVKDGQRLVLNILSGQNSKYYNLAQLREKIMSDYNEFIKAHPNDMFIFSQKSRVWAKRAGIVDYDYSEDHSGEKGIIDIPGYTENAPIAFIRRTGEAEVINGGDKSAVDKVSDTFNDASANTESGNDKRGNLYYLAKVNDEQYIPIRLNVEHFNSNTQELDNPVFARIRQLLSDIAEIVQNTTEENIESQNDKMRFVLSKLSDNLDLSNTFFALANFDGIGIGLRITPDLRVPTEERDDAIRTPEQITNSWLINYISSLDRSLQIRQNEDGSVTNFSEYVENGLITSNAKRMYPKGMDFYTNPWVGDKFAPVTGTQREVLSDTTVAEAHAEPVQPQPFPDFFGLNEFSEMNEPQNEDYGETEDMPEEVTVFNYYEPFDVLSSDTQSLLLAKGHTKEEWDNLSPALREKILKCL